MPGDAHYQPMMPGESNGLLSPLQARLRFMATGHFLTKWEDMYDLLASVMTVDYPKVSAQEDIEIRRKLWEAGV